MRVGIDQARNDPAAACVDDASGVRDAKARGATHLPNAVALDEDDAVVDLLTGDDVEKRGAGDCQNSGSVRLCGCLPIRSDADGCGRGDENNQRAKVFLHETKQELAGRTIAFIELSCAFRCAPLSSIVMVDPKS